MRERVELRGSSWDLCKDDTALFGPCNKKPPTFVGGQLSCSRGQPHLSQPRGDGPVSGPRPTPAAYLWTRQRSSSLYSISLRPATGLLRSLLLSVTVVSAFARQDQRERVQVPSLRCLRVLQRFDSPSSVHWLRHLYILALREPSRSRTGLNGVRARHIKPICQEPLESRTRFERASSG